MMHQPLLPVDLSLHHHILPLDALMNELIVRPQRRSLTEIFLANRTRVSEPQVDALLVSLQRIAVAETLVAELALEWPLVRVASQMRRQLSFALARLVADLARIALTGVHRPVVVLQGSDADKAGLARLTLVRLHAFVNHLVLIQVRFGEEVLAAELANKSQPVHAILVHLQFFVGGERQIAVIAFVGFFTRMDPLVDLKPVFTTKRLATKLTHMLFQSPFVLALVVIPTLVVSVTFVAKLTLVGSFIGVYSRVDFQRFFRFHFLAAILARKL